MGIWRDVSLLSYDAGRIEDVFLQTKSISDSLADILAKFEIESLQEEKLTHKIENKTTDETEGFGTP